MIWFLNGRYLPAQKAKIPINDLAVLRGFGVFDFLVTYNYQPFLLTEHLRRLYRSARLLQLKIPYSQNQLKNFIAQAIKKNHWPSLTLRIVVTGGISQSNIFPEGKTSVAVLAEKRIPYPKTCYKKGVKIKTYEYQRFLPEAKHLDYLAAVVTKSKAVKKGFLEVLYTWQGKILECTTSNFYLVKNKVLVTPQTDILQGITKKVILSLAKKMMKVEERPVLVNELKTADEALISASDKEIMPVVQINNLKVNGGKPGPYTRKLMAAFHVYTQNFSQRVSPE